MRVNVERDRDGRVAEALGDDLRVDARLERERRVGVAQVMQSDLRNSAPFTWTVERLRERIRAERRSVRLAKHGGQGWPVVGSVLGVRLAARP